MSRKPGWLDAIAMLLVMSSGAPDASANSAGIFGYSGKQNDRICTQCHGGGTFPDVSIDGPLQVAAGSLSTFQLVVKSNNTLGQKYGGFNVAAAAGTLAVTGVGTRLWPMSGEISHSIAKKITNGVVGWSFTWRAPTVPGTYEIFGAGNSVNHDGGQGGDAAVGVVVSIDVMPVAASPSPTATFATPTASATVVPPTATITATSPPPPSPTQTPVATPTHVSCSGDCDGNGLLDAVDLQRIVDVLDLCEPCVAGGVVAGCPAAGECQGADFDQNGCLTAGELTRAVDRTLNNSSCP